MNALKNINEGLMSFIQLLDVHHRGAQYRKRPRAGRFEQSQFSTRALADSGGTTGRASRDGAAGLRSHSGGMSHRQA